MMTILISSIVTKKLCSLIMIVPIITLIANIFSIIPTPTLMQIFMIPKLNISPFLHMLYKLISPFIIVISFVIGLTFIFGLGFQFILYGIIESSFQVIGSQTNKNCNFPILLIILAVISQFVCHFIKETIQCLIHTTAANNYTKEQFERYMKLDSDSRNVYMATSFYSEIKDLIFNIANLAIFGIFKLASLLENIIIVVVIFYFRGYYGYLIGLLIGHICWFNIFTKYKFKEWKLIRTVYREKMSACEAQVQILLPEFQQQRESKNNIVDNIIYSSQATYCGSLVFCKFLMLTNVATHMSIICFLIYWWIIDGEYVDFLVLMQLINKLNNSIIQIGELYAQFTKIETSFIKYESNWIKLTQNEPPLPQNFPAEGLIFSSVRIERNQFRFTTNNLRIKCGETYFVKGESGGGKTSLLLALSGDIKGATLENGVDPAAYSNNFVIAYQENQIPTRGITLRQILNVTSQNESKVLNILRYVELDNWVKNLVEKQDKKTSLYDLYLPNKNLSVLFRIISDLFLFKMIERKYNETKISNPFDIVLSGASGGQKTRLKLARTILRANENTKIMMLDEPEAGIPPDQAGRIIKNLLTCPELEKCTKIIVTHLCDCQLYSIKRNQTWILQNGTMNIIS